MQRMHDRAQSLAPTLALSRELNSLASDPKTCAEDFANLAWNFPARRTLSRPLASAARRHAATTAPMARCIFDPQPSFEPMTDQEEPVMTPCRFHRRLRFVPDAGRGLEMGPVCSST